MIKKISIYIVLLLISGAGATAQTIGSSPYSQYGLGLYKDPLLPQNRAMGGIGAAISRIGSYNNINLANMASLADLRMTTFDIGLLNSYTALKNSTANQKPIMNWAFSHIVFGIPVNKKSALSFGLVPYSDLGYKYGVTGKIDTNAVRYVYAGDGGLSKAYLGYGLHFGTHWNVGASLGYIFGKLDQSGSAEFTNTSLLNSRISKSNSVGGMNYDYGIQYFTNLNAKTRLSLGYSGSTGNKIGLTMTNLNTLYYSVDGEDSGIQDTVSFSTAESKIKLPVMQRAGFAIERAGKWLIGGDLSYGGWSKYRVAGINQGLHNNFTASLGGQITPDLNSISNYFKLVDYRAGFRYTKTYMYVNNTNINDAALTLGLGLPLPGNRGVSFYKINLSSEIGQRGSLKNGLVRERYTNIFIGVTLNDLWFQKFKFQ